MIELKFSTKRGKQVYNMGFVCQAETLFDLYKKPSKLKIEAFEECFRRYCVTKNSFGFGVGNANTFGFTCKWFGEENGTTFMRVETKDNSYKVWLNR